MGQACIVYLSTAVPDLAHTCMTSDAKDREAPGAWVIMKARASM